VLLVISLAVLRFARSHHLVERATEFLRPSRSRRARC